MKGKDYEPELGQAFFGQPSQELSCPTWLEAFLFYLRDKIDIYMWNTTQKEIPSPFVNSGLAFKNDTFEVIAYDWHDERDQDFNFKYKDIKISWYKYLGRGMSINKNITSQEGIDMLNDCLKSLGYV